MNLNKTRRKVEIEFQKNRIEIRIFPNTSAFIVNQHLKQYPSIFFLQELPFRKLIYKILRICTIVTLT